MQKAQQIIADFLNDENGEAAAKKAASELLKKLKDAGIILKHNRHKVKTTRWAKNALKAVCVATDYDGKEENDLNTYIADLLANIMHLSHQRGFDFDYQLERAKNHFGVESVEGEM